MAKANIARFASRAAKRAKRICYSHVFIIVSGVLTLLFIAYYVTAIVVCTVYDNNPVLFCGAKFQEFRNKILLEGESDGGDNSYAIKQVEKQVGDTTYYVGVSTKDCASDYFQILFWATPQSEDYQIAVGLCPGLYFLEGSALQGGYCAFAALADSKGEIYGASTFTRIIYNINGDLTYSVLAPKFVYLDTSKPLPPGIDEEKTSKIANEAIVSFFPRIDSVFQSCGLEVSPLGDVEYNKGMRPHESLGVHPALLILLSFLAAPLAVLFLVSWSHQLEEDQRFRLICKGTLRFSRLERAVPYREKGDPMPEYEFEGGSVIEEKEKPKEIEELPHRASAFEAWLTRKHIQPVLGEWFFRGIGLFLVALATIVTFIGSHFSDSSVEGVVFATMKPYLDSASTTGMFILVIALVGVISETHKGLKLSTNVFFALGLAFYCVMGALYVILDLTTPVTRAAFGFAMSDLLAAVSAGNIFLGIGVFSMIGFFLFHNPPRWFIRRRVFRAFAAIPTLLAVGSIVFGILLKTSSQVPSYWVRNLLFTKNFEHLLFGVAYEYIIFGFRSHMSKKYGEDNVEAKMAEPMVQFQKNFILIAFIALYTIAFYCVPKEVRIVLGLSSHTYIILLAPFFLFYKPAGQNHKTRDDIIYYILYVLAMYTPAIINGAFKIFSGIAG